jgi:hypothetical protein
MPFIFSCCLEWLLLVQKLKQLVARMELILTQKYRERAFVAFETKMDSSTECPLFNTGAYWAKARMFLKEIQQGYYSDPPGFDDFYTVRLDDKGTPKTDKHGIQLITCR